MSRRKRYLTIGALVLALVTFEVVYQVVRTPVATVVIVNQGVEPIEDLRLTSGGLSSSVARIEAGASARVKVAGRGKQRLSVKYRQKGNALSDFEVSGFNPAMLSREGYQLVLSIRQNELERYQEDADPSWLSEQASRLRAWFVESLESR